MHSESSSCFRQNLQDARCEFCSQDHSPTIRKISGNARMGNQSWCQYATNVRMSGGSPGILLA